MDKIKKKKTRINLFDIINPDAAGIDIGDKEYVVAVGPHKTETPIQCFGTFTEDLYKISDWLTLLGITSVAMESTGVYWVHLFLHLEAQGFDVLLVNAKHVKNVSGRKKDETDASWIQKLHTCGLLRASFQPSKEIRSLRELTRHRKRLIEDKTSSLNRLQKSLELMNVKIHTVISDIDGLTGKRIIEAIISGNTDAEHLVTLSDPRIQADREIMIKSLQGIWSADHLFTLKQNYEHYQFIQRQIQQVDEQLEIYLLKIAQSKKVIKVSEKKKVTRKRSTSKHKIRFNATQCITDILEVNPTLIDGISEWSALQILAETGLDLSQFKTEKHFTRWLGLAPDTQISGGKIIRTKRAKTKNNAGQIFKMCASTLGRSQKPLGDFFRKIQARHGRAKAIVATARKMAVVYYKIITEKTEYNPLYLIKANADYKQRKILYLEKQLAKLKAV